MTPNRLRECLALLNWTQRGLARAINRDEGTVRQWLRGEGKIPDDIAAGVEKLARFHERNPLPRKEQP